MGGGGTQGSIETLQIDPSLRRKLFEQIDANESSVGDLSAQARQAQGQLKTDFLQYKPNLNSNFQQFNPNLNTEFKGPQFSNTLDAFSNAMISQGQQAGQQRLNATQSQTSQQFRGNPAVAQILNRQAAATSQVNQNPLMFQAANDQRQREGMQYQLEQQAQGQTNQARLAQGQELARLLQLGNQTTATQSEYGANLQGLQNAAVGQHLQIGSVPAQAQSTLLQTLAALAALTGAKQVAPYNGASGSNDSRPLPPPNFNGHNNAAPGSPGSPYRAP